MCWANERARDGCRKNEQQQQRQQRWQQQNTRRRGDVNIRCTSAFHREINALSTCNTSAVCGLAFVWPCSHSPSLSHPHLLACRRMYSMRAVFYTNLAPLVVFHQSAGHERARTRICERLKTLVCWLANATAAADVCVPQHKVERFTRMLLLNSYYA